MWRRLFRFVRFASIAGVLVGITLAVITWLSSDHFSAFGGAPELARLRSSSQFRETAFANPETTSLMAAAHWPDALSRWAFGKELREPGCPLPLYPDTSIQLSKPAASGLRITWLGHSTVLIEIDGAAVLTDPMWSERASPSRWAGPKRFHPPPLALEALPRLDAVVISHEHYDHLDQNTVRALAARGVTFHVPLGIGAHLAAWAVPAAQIVEHDWWQDAVLPGGIRVVSTPARHFNGRGVPWRTGSLWT